MTDQQFREIQLTGKQLVFAFMASVVVAVTIFLLGISVGRGVRSAGGAPADVAADASASRDLQPPAVMPQATRTTPADLSYHDQLQGQTPPRAAAVPGRQADAPKPDEAPSAVDEPAAGQGGAAKVTAPPAPAVAAKTTTTVPAATATPAAPPKAVASSMPAPAKAAPADTAAPAKGGWVLQVGAFRSRENADRLVSRLKSKGFAASTISGGGSLVRVRVGPYADRADADRAAARLQREEGLKPSVQH